MPFQADRSLTLRVGGLFLPQVPAGAGQCHPAFQPVGITFAAVLRTRKHL